MLNRNNSLLNLIIILSSFFFFTVLSAENNDFILPKKKIFIPSSDDLKSKKKTINIESKSNSLPRKKPLKKKINISKKIANKEKIVAVDDFNSPQKKPIFKNKIRNRELIEKFLETKEGTLIDFLDDMEVALNKRCILL